LSFLKILSLSILIIVSGCKKEDEVQQSSQPDFQAQFTTTSVTDIMPPALQTNGDAMGNMMLSQINTYMMLPSMYMTAFGGMLQEIPSNAKMGTASPPPPTWTWNYGGYVITYTYNQTSTQYTFSYTVAMNGSVWYSITGWENINGSAGHWVYNFNLSNIPGGASASNWAIVFDWQQPSTGEYDFQMSYDFGSSTPDVYVDMHVDSNTGSGYYDYYTPSNTLMYNYTWSNFGNNGSFTNYSFSPPQTTIWP
jgi:hypothetical protein